MIPLKDLLKQRNYAWMGELKALTVMDVFSRIITAHDTLSGFQGSFKPAFYKGGVLFITIAHPVIAHKINQYKDDLLRDLNQRLAEQRVRVTDFCYLS